MTLAGNDAAAYAPCLRHQMHIRRVYDTMESLF